MYTGDFNNSRKNFFKARVAPNKKKVMFRWGKERKNNVSFR